MIRRFGLVAVVLGFSSSCDGCARPEPLVEETKPTVEANEMPKSIGIASMDADGTVVLQLRAEGPGGAVGDALVRYPKSHAKYESVLEHLGGLRPGEKKPVPPWPDQDLSEK